MDARKSIPKHSARLSHKDRLECLQAAAQFSPLHHKFEEYA